jgi:CBS domain containing-hemolysin-like protein
MEDILEELVGEIWDELDDEEVQQFTMIDENDYIVMTNVLVEEFWEYFDLEGEIETEATTINGLITEQADCIPEIGYSFEIENLSIKVTKANEFMTEEISVRVTPKETEEIEED